MRFFSNAQISLAPARRLPGRRSRVPLHIQLFGVACIVMSAPGCTPAPSPATPAPPADAQRLDSVELGPTLARAVADAGPQLRDQAGRQSRLAWTLYRLPLTWTREKLAAHYVSRAAAAGYVSMPSRSGFGLLGPHYQQMFSSTKHPEWPFAVVWAAPQPGERASVLVVVTFSEEASR